MSNDLGELLAPAFRQPAEPAPLGDAAAATSPAVGIGLGTGPDVRAAIPTGVELKHALQEMFSAESGVERALCQLGLEAVLAQIVDEYGRAKVKAALNRIPNKRILHGHLIFRRALACFCAH